MKTFFLLVLCFLFVVPPLIAVKPPVALVRSQQQVTTEFSRLDRGLQRAARELGKTGLTGDGARRILAATCTEFGYTADCSTVDIHGRIIMVEPAPYRSAEGRDISDQAHVRRILMRHKPVLSPVFRSVEGFDAVDVEYPVFNREGRFVGAVSLLFKPEQFLGEIIRPIVKGGVVDIWVMEKGGRILYDADHEQVGLNLFTSPPFQSYKELLLLAKKIDRTARGDGHYQFKRYNLTDRDAGKKAGWQSVSLYGTSWRLVGVQLDGAHNSHPGRDGR